MKGNILGLSEYSKLNLIIQTTKLLFECNSHKNDQRSDFHERLPATMKTQ